MAGLAVGAAVDAFGCDGVFGGTQRKSRVMIQQLVLADETQSATELPGPPESGSSQNDAVGWRIPIR